MFKVWTFSGHFEISRRFVAISSRYDDHTHREHGLVASAASDWGLEVVTYPMSIMIAAGGITAALTGKWTLKVATSRSRL